MNKIIGSMAVDETDEGFAAKVAEIVTADLYAKLPQVADPEFPESERAILIGCMVNAFYNGARWAEEQLRQEVKPKIIHPVMR